MKDTMMRSYAFMRIGQSVLAMLSIAILLVGCTSVQAPLSSVPSEDHITCMRTNKFITLIVTQCSPRKLDMPRYAKQYWQKETQIYADHIDWYCRFILECTGFTISQLRDSTHSSLRVNCGGASVSQEYSVSSGGWSMGTQTGWGGYCAIETQLHCGSLPAVVDRSVYQEDLHSQSSSLPNMSLELALRRSGFHNRFARLIKSLRTEREFTRAYETFLNAAMEGYALKSWPEQWKEFQEIAICDAIFQLDAIVSPKQSACNTQLASWPGGGGINRSTIETLQHIVSDTNQTCYARAKAATALGAIRTSKPYDRYLDDVLMDVFLDGQNDSLRGNEGHDLRTKCAQSLGLIPSVVRWQSPEMSGDALRRYNDKLQKQYALLSHSPAGESLMRNPPDLLAATSNALQRIAATKSHKGISP